jgi:hypothetical protein
MTWWRWPAALLVDAPHGPPAAVDGVVQAVLIDPGTEAGRAELEGIAHPGLRATAVTSPLCNILHPKRRGTS